LDNKKAEVEATKVIVMVAENFQVDGWSGLINLQNRSKYSNFGIQQVHSLFIIHLKVLQKFLKTKRL
jgi:hypothetical protein